MMTLINKENIQLWLAIQHWTWLEFLSFLEAFYQISVVDNIHEGWSSLADGWDYSVSTEMQVSG